MTYYDEIKLGQLLRALPPAPEAWVRSAQELPLARLRLDDMLEEVVERARADQDFRRALIADLEQALADAGYEPDPSLVEAVRERLPAREG